MDESFHDHLAGQGSGDGGVLTAGQEGDGKQGAGAGGADQGLRSL